MGTSYLCCRSGSEVSTENMGSFDVFVAPFSGTWIPRVVSCIAIKSAENKIE